VGRALLLVLGAVSKDVKRGYRRHAHAARDRLRRSPLAAAPTLAAIVAAAGALASCGGSSHAASAAQSTVQGASEVSAQPVSSTGPNPFTPAVGTDRAGVTPPPAPSSATGPTTHHGNLPGLYGGTRSNRSCDAKKLIAFLEQNPAKAAAWASTLGIAPSQIRHYVSGLTPVILRSDTRTTNHSYANGQATAFQAVLQAGTAVFVDKYGTPVVKCYCGNPLTPPYLLSAPQYVGPLWSDFQPSHITIIVASVTIINYFTFYDFDTGTTFTEPPGSTTTTTPTTTTPQPSTTTPTQPGPSQGYSPPPQTQTYTAPTHTYTYTTPTDTTPTQTDTTPTPTNTQSIPCGQGNGYC
jgi:hypothetical protein